MTDRGYDEGAPLSAVRTWLVDAGCDADRASALCAALRWPLDCGAAAWSARVAAAASALLHERARRVWRRQVATLLAAVALALPLSAIIGVYGLRLAYEVLCGLMPAPIATYVVATYAMMALGVVGATYAMIPVAIGRSRDRLAVAQAWAAAPPLEEVIR